MNAPHHGGIVKQVLSGDAVVIRGQPKGGPPPERTLYLSNITAPKMARRPNPQMQRANQEDENFGWESREFLRKKLVGKDVTFTVETKVPSSGREYGNIFLKSSLSEEPENMIETLLSEGMVELRKESMRNKEDLASKLNSLEESAKAGKKGKWGTDGVKRQISWSLDVPRNLVDQFKQQKIDAVVEQVRDGSTLRLFLLPSFHYITLMISGVKCPYFKRDGESVIAEPFAAEARFFVENRLLQQNVKVILESASNDNLVGSVIHPHGNIAELLLREGMAKCVNWSSEVVTSGMDKLRAAEKFAKEKRIRIWKDYTPTTVSLPAGDNNYTAQVVEVALGDSLVVKLLDGQFKKICLSSVRPPRLKEEEKKETRVRPLYDIPYMFEAREYLRQKLIGKKVKITTDYIQPANAGFPERTCATVCLGDGDHDINVAEALLSKGLATVIRYKQDDDQRSPHYDALIVAEQRASKSCKGLHSTGDRPLHRVSDITGEQKARQFLPHLQRAGQTDALVEHVFSGSRLKVYIPKETCTITVLLAGIICPRAARQLPNGRATVEESGVKEALTFTKELCLQREVKVEVESIDKGGNFIGWVTLDNRTNLSVALVENGLAAMHFSAERSSYKNILLSSEERAKAENKGIWKNYVEPKVQEVSQELDSSERKVALKTVVVTEVLDDGSFYVQYCDSGAKVEALIQQIQLEFSRNTALPGAFKPRIGALCAARFSCDNKWYRAKVQSLSGNQVKVLFIDYGNSECVPIDELAILPDVYHTSKLPEQAHHFHLAFVNIPDELESRLDAVAAIRDILLDRKLSLNLEYKTNEKQSVTVLECDKDIVIGLIKDGLLLVEKRREKRFHPMIQEYLTCQEDARQNHRNLWRYGDFLPDDAAEFGMGKPK